MKKIILGLICVLFLVGCSCNNDKAADVVEKYLNDYKGLSDEVLKSIDEMVEREELNDKQKEDYKEVLKRQYRDINYIIENESYNGDTANVTVKITVYDLYKSQKDANSYLNDNPDKFLTNGAYDKEKYLDYKLEQMKKMNETVSYNVVFKTVKVDSKWQVEQPDEDVLEKIHGIYNYEESND